MLAYTCFIQWCRRWCCFSRVLSAKVRLADSGQCRHGSGQRALVERSFRASSWCFLRCFGQRSYLRYAPSRYSFFGSRSGHVFPLLILLLPDRLARFGRKYTLLGFSLLFLLGAVRIFPCSYWCSIVTYPATPCSDSSNCRQRYHPWSWLHLRRTCCRGCRYRWNLCCCTFFRFRVCSERSSWAYHRSLPGHGGRWCHAFIFHQLCVDLFFSTQQKLISNILRRCQLAHGE